MSKMLVTGAAGFIGSHVAAVLLDAGHTVVGLDNLNAYYDVTLKLARLARLEGRAGFTFVKLDLADQAGMAALFTDHNFDTVIHLAAQAGVRYSLEAPHAYVDSNITGFLNVLEGCRATGVGHLVYASTSSVYGANTAMPFSVHHAVNHPLSLYAATKKANELMAHTYSHLFGVPTTGLRFFTVYGPWGRPDMALFKFTRAALAGEPIDVYNYGDMARDFTYVDDIAEGVVRVAARPPAPNALWSSDTPDPATSSAPYRVFNIGNSAPVPLTAMIDALERELGRPIERRLLPMQPGDVPATFADVSELEALTEFRPETSIESGIASFVEWYRRYYNA